EDLKCAILAAAVDDDHLGKYLRDHTQDRLDPEVLVLDPDQRGNLAPSHRRVPATEAEAFDVPPPEQRPSREGGHPARYERAVAGCRPAHIGAALVHSLSTARSVSTMSVRSASVRSGELET